MTRDAGHIKRAGTMQQINIDIHKYTVLKIVKNKRDEKSTYRIHVHTSLTLLLTKSLS